MVGFDANTERQISDMLERLAGAAAGLAGRLGAPVGQTGAGPKRNSAEWTKRFFA